ncbi:hypothetical protein GCM10027199_41260 [Amycolatopsis magusensis]
MFDSPSPLLGSYGTGWTSASVQKRLLGYDVCRTRTPPPAPARTSMTRGVAAPGTPNAFVLFMTIQARTRPRLTLFPEKLPHSSFPPFRMLEQQCVPEQFHRG